MFFFRFGWFVWSKQNFTAFGRWIENQTYSISNNRSRGCYFGSYIIKSNGNKSNNTWYVYPRFLQIKMELFKPAIIIKSNLQVLLFFSMPILISGPFLILTCVWLPLAFLTIITVFHKYSRVPKSSAAISCLLFAIGLEELIVRTLKMYVGRLRPNFYSMCGFNKTTLQCMAPLSLQYEARQSFPSGHASLSFCSMGVLMWFGFGCLTSLFRDINHLKSKIVTLTAFSPLLYSTFVASSRIVDNWHHPSDVIAGAIIGFVSATISSYLW